MATKYPTPEQEQISDISALTPLQAAWTAAQQANSKASPFVFLEPALLAAIARRDLEIMDWILSQTGEPTPKAIKAAVQASYTAALELFLKRGWDLNSAPRHPPQPPYLAIAAKLNNRPLIRWFLSHGADPNIPAPNNTATVLTSAADFSTVDTMALLINEAGGDVHRGSPLIAAAASSEPGRLEMARYLVGAGAPLNALQHSDDERRFKTYRAIGLGTALHASVRNDRREMCALLLDLGADKNVRDTKGRTALDLAREMGLWEVGRLLLDEVGELVEVDEREEERKWEEAVKGMEMGSEDEDDDDEIGFDDSGESEEQDDATEPEGIGEGRLAAPAASQRCFEEGLFQWDASPRKCIAR